MSKKRTEKDRKSDAPLFGHEIINQLSVIVGRCDLLKEDLQDTSHQKQIELIKDTAIAIADEIKQYQRTHYDIKKAG
jgi:nitrogen-specific signal transduction histidine kinase